MAIAKISPFYYHFIYCFFFFLSFYFIFKQKVKNRIFPLLFFFIIISYKLTLSKLKVFFFARSSDCFTWKLKNMVMSDVSTVDN
jgi:hypothetical protein